jgi:AraC-like DNA-binding protein
MKVQFKKEGISKQWLIDIASEMSKQSACNIEMKNDKIIFPERVATGSISYHLLEDDIEMALFNVTFKEAFYIERITTDENKFYTMHIHCSPNELSHFLDGEESKVGGPVNALVFWSASDITSAFKIEAGETFLALMVYMKKEFLQKALGSSDNPLLPDGGSPYDVSGSSADRSLIGQRRVIPRSMKSKLGRMKYELMQEIITFDNNSSMPEKLFLKANILKILALFIKRVTERRKKKEETERFSDTAKILEIKKMIDGSAGSMHMSLDDLAKTAAISKTKLKTKFKEVVGKSAYQYYLEVKMEKARALLEDTSVPVSDVAYELGFKSPSHFSQSFKKHYGMNPKSVAGVRS